MRIVLAAALVGVLAGGMARGEILRPQTTCERVADIMYGDDEKERSGVGQFILDAIYERDTQVALIKRTSMLNNIQDPGLIILVKRTIALCQEDRNRPAIAREAAFAVYDAVRKSMADIGKELSGETSPIKSRKH